jgi:cell division protein ZapA (FtsZ GTPase activity inhibitor)
MRFLKQYRYVLTFMGLLVFCSIMVIRGLQARQSKHVQLREAMVLLHSRGYTNEAERIFQRMIRQTQELSNRALLDDFQRTLQLVDPAVKQKGNPIWKYYWMVSQELERRSESTLKQALELAAEN